MGSGPTAAQARPAVWRVALSPAPRQERGWPRPAATKCGSSSGSRVLRWSIPQYRAFLALRFRHLFRVAAPAHVSDFDFKALMARSSIPAHRVRGDIPPSRGLNLWIRRKSLHGVRWGPDIRAEGSRWDGDSRQRPVHHAAGAPSAVFLERTSSSSAQELRATPKSRPVTRERDGRVFSTVGGYGPRWTWNTGAGEVGGTGLPFVHVMRGRFSGTAAQDCLRPELKPFFARRRRSSVGGRSLEVALPTGTLAVISLSAGLRLRGWSL